MRLGPPSALSPTKHDTAWVARYSPACMEHLIRTSRARHLPSKEFLLPGCFTFGPMPTVIHRLLRLWQFAYCRCTAVLDVHFPSETVLACCMSLASICWSFALWMVAGIALGIVAGHKWLANVVSRCRPCRGECLCSLWKSY